MTDTTIPTPDPSTPQEPDETREPATPTAIRHARRGAHRRPHWWQQVRLSRRGRRS